MSNRKRFLAVVLAVMMVFGTMATMSVSAATNKFADVPASNRELTQALSVLGDLAIVRGTGEDPETGDMLFSGDAPVTRQQFALFVARITTGTPEYFVADPDSPTIFEDVVDPTYFTAINHCVESGIINGYPDGTFKPNNTIQFQEAMKMLVTALGYTSLTYPQGYLSKANEEGVALIGKWVQTTGFEFEKTGLTYELTRNDMAKLLYNFLLTYYNKLGSRWNGVTGQYEPIEDKSAVISKFGITPYMGYVTAVQNYATRLEIEDYNRTGLGITFQGSPIDEREASGTYTRNPRDLQISYADEGAITAAERDRRFINSANIKDLYVTYDQIGMDKPTDPEDLLDLSLSMLGLKIVVYRHTTLKAQTVNTALPAAVIIGTKTLVNDPAVNTAKVNTTSIATTTVPKIAVSSVDSLTLGTDDGAATYNQRKGGSEALGHGEKDLNLFTNLYAFTDTGYLVSDGGDKFKSRIGKDVAGTPAQWIWDPVQLKPVLVGGDAGGFVYEDDILAYDGKKSTTDNSNNSNAQIRNKTRLSIAEDSIEEELAKFVNGAGHYELYYVNNGTTSEGLAEFYYIFIPYRVGAVHRNTSSAIDIRNKSEDGNDGNLERVSGDKYDATKKTDGIRIHRGVNEIEIPTISDDAARNSIGVAYLYTYFGNQYKDLVVKEELVRAATNVEVTRTRNISTSSAAVDFTNTSYSTATFSFVGNASKALGAYQASQVMNDRFVLGRKYNVFEDAFGNPLIAVETSRPTTPSTPWIYGVITDTNTPVAIGYANGTVGFRYEIFNATSNKFETVILRPTSGSAIGTDTDLSGTYIGMKLNHADGSYNAYVLEDNSGAKGTNDELRVLLRTTDETKYATRLAPIPSGTAPISSWIDKAVSNRLNFSQTVGGIANNASRYYDTGDFTQVNASAILSSSTKVLVYTTNPGIDPITGNAAAAAGMYPYNNLPNLDITKAAFIAVGDGNSTRTADVVFITVDNTISPTTPITNYGVILDQWNVERTFSGTNPVTGLQTEYIVRKVFVYAASGDNKIVEVCAPVGDPLLQTGRLVGINDNVRVNNIRTISDVTGNQTDRDDAVRLANTGWSHYAGNSYNAYNKIMSSLKGVGTVVWHDLDTITKEENNKRNALISAINAYGVSSIDAILDGNGGYTAVATVTLANVMTAIESAAVIDRQTTVAANIVPGASRVGTPANATAISAVLPAGTVQDSFDAYIVALNLTTADTYTPASSDVIGGTSIGKTTTTYFGQVTNYRANESMYVDGNYVRLIDNVFRVSYITERFDIRRSGGTPANPSWTSPYSTTNPWVGPDKNSGNVSDAGGNVRVTSPELISWGYDTHQIYGLRAISQYNWDTVSDRTWAVVTIDNNTGTPLAITLIIANPSVHDNHNIANGLTKNGEYWDWQN